MNQINRDFSLFRFACEALPAGVFDNAQNVRSLLNYTMDTLEEGLIDLNLRPDGADGSHNTEATMLDMIRKKNPDSEIETVIALGHLLEEHPDRARYLLREIAQDENFLERFKSALTLVLEEKPL